MLQVFSRISKWIRIARIYSLFIILSVHEFEVIKRHGAFEERERFGPTEKLSELIIKRKRIKTKIRLEDNKMKIKFLVKQKMTEKLDKMLFKYKNDAVKNALIVTEQKTEAR